MSSQNVLDLLGKSDNPNESDTLKNTIFSEHNASIDPNESSSPDVLVTHFFHNQSSSPLSSHGFGFRQPSPNQLLKRMQTLSLQRSSYMQTTNVILDRKIHPSKG